MNTNYLTFALIACHFAATSILAEETCARGMHAVVATQNESMSAAWASGSFVAAGGTRGSVRLHCGEIWDWDTVDQLQGKVRRSVLLHRGEIWDWD
jgi:hypothetical protein